MRSILESIETPTAIKSFATVLLSIIFILCIALFFPWTQTITGEGSVTVFSPMERPQAIHTQIDAKIKKWYVHEGDFVKKGQILLELEELQSQFLDVNQLSKLQNQKLALLSQQGANYKLINSLEKQQESLYDIQDSAVPNAKLEIQQKFDRLRSTEQKYTAAKQVFTTSELNYNRRKSLFEKGLNSKRELELAELSYIQSKAELEASQAELDIAKRGTLISENDFNQISAENNFKINEADAKIAQALEKIALVNQNIYKLDIDLSNLSERIEQRKIYSPVNGRIVRLRVLGFSETVKAGTELALIVPKSSDPAVELYISGYAAPLISEGRSVRLQFAGWPSLQFSGWPSVSLGSFAGKVAVIDATNTAQNEYRILVKPDYQRIKNGQEEAWPKLDQLRPGTKAIGWILLDEVPLWYELWRILNGFPPTIMENFPKNKTAQIKKK